MEKISREEIIKKVYDIKPTKDGDIDYEKITKIQPILDLRSSVFGESISSVELSEGKSTVDLRARELFAFKKEPKIKKKKFFVQRFFLPKFLKLPEFSKTLAFSFALIFLIVFSLSGYRLFSKKIALFRAEVLSLLENSGSDSLSLNVFDIHGFLTSEGSSFEEIKTKILLTKKQVDALKRELRPIEKVFSLISFGKKRNIEDSIELLDKSIELGLSSIEVMEKMFPDQMFCSLVGDVECKRKFKENFLLLEEENKELSRNLALIQKSLSGLSKIPFFGLDPEIFDDFNKKYLFFQEKLALERSYISLAKKILGFGRERNYFILFQNESELRASGGFIGSVLEIQIVDGGLASMKFFDIYDIDGQIKESYIPPHQLWRITPVWKTRDANWFFDFPQSARKVIFFLNKSAYFKDMKIDGIFALNTKILRDLLDVSGPLDLRKYGVINKDNFLEILQYNTEMGPDAFTNRPKKIIKKLVEIVFHKLSSFNSEQKEELARKIFYRLENKDIQVYFTDPVLESFVRQFHFGGSVLEEEKSQDYLALVDSNIAGGKTDIFIKEKVSLETTVEEDGSIVNTLTIIKSHLGERAKFPFWRKLNKDYLRIFVPKGSVLISASGFRSRIIKPVVDYSSPKYLVDNDLNELEVGITKDEKSGLEIFKESGKTVFGGWVYTYPGETEKVTIVYKLPFVFSLSSLPQRKLSLLLQRQSGKNYSFEWKINLDKHYIFAGQKSHSYHLEVKKLKAIEFFSSPPISVLAGF